VLYIYAAGILYSKIEKIEKCAPLNFDCGIEAGNIFKADG
jgi:hypothetical protein